MTIPPRHGKSTLISHYTPAWFLGHYPEKEVVLCSYEADFAAKWGRDVRNTLREYGPAIFDIDVDPNSSAASRWNTTKGGAMYCAGVNGPITGKGAHLLIIDDPIKNDEEANSPVMREKAWNWFLSTAFSRLNKNGSVIIVMTRWNEDDIVGRLLSQKIEEDNPELRDFAQHKWELINLPALAEKDEEWLDGSWTRQEGDPLWPEMYDKNALYNIKAVVGGYWWAALYQQRPAPLEGNLFKRPDSGFPSFKNLGNVYVLPQYEVSKDQCTIFQTIDPALTIKTSADWFTISTWAITPRKDVLWLDLQRKRLEAPDQQEFMMANYLKWRPSIVGFEKSTANLAVVQYAKRTGLPIVELAADRDKISRALPAAARMSGGTVFHAEGAPWWPDAEVQLLAFPNAAHDDTVDTLSYAIIVLLTMIMNTAGGSIERESFRGSMDRIANPDPGDDVEYKSRCQKCDGIVKGEELSRRNSGKISIVKFNCSKDSYSWNEQIHNRK